jgi:hypothetical protein
MNERFFKDGFSMYRTRTVVSCVAYKMQLSHFKMKMDYKWEKYSRQPEKNVRL